MNRSIAFLAGVVALTTALFAVPNRASADPVGPSPVKIPPGMLSIDSFGIERLKIGMYAKGKISTTSTKPIYVKYTISKQYGNEWTTVQSGQVMVSSQKAMDVSGAVKPSGHPQTFKLATSVLGMGISRTKEFSLAPSFKYIVRYDTSGNRSDGHWVLVAVYNDENSGLLNVDKLARKMSDSMATYGFHTEIRMKSTSNVFLGNSYRKSVFIRTSKPIERDFETKKEAKAFHDKLRKTVPSSDLTVEDVRKQ